MNLTQSLKSKAFDLGFDVVGVAPAGPSPDHERYVQWLQAGHLGEMGYLARHSELKADPRSLLPEAKSLVLVGLNYAQPVDATLRADPSRGQIAAYALGDDYHDVMRQALIELDGWLRNQSGRLSLGRVFVDSAPVLERSWGMQAGLGFIGKNTCLIHPDIGSWFFLGGLLVPEILDYDEPLQEVPMRDQGLEIKKSTTESSISNLQSPIDLPAWRFDDGRLATCGRCVRCLDICPTGALISPYQLDARLCISYLTIELKGEIPPPLRPQLGNWVFGCDLCQDVCPWNRHTMATSHPRLQPGPERLAPPLASLLVLDQDAFNQRFRKSPARRAKWVGFMRNVCVAAGNWGEPSLLPELQRHLFESPALVAVHAAWALARLAGGAGRVALNRAYDKVPDARLRAAIEAALATG